MTPFRVRIAGGLLTGAALVILLSASARSGLVQQPIEKRDPGTLAPGLQHREIRRGDPTGTGAGDRWSIHVLELDPALVRLELALAMDELVGAETTSSIALRRGALAAVNGGYFRTSGLLRGEPRGIIARRGKLLSEPEHRRSGLAVRMTKAGFQLAMARFDFRSEAIFSDGRRRAINGLNRPLEAEELILYTPEFHRTTLGDSRNCELLVGRYGAARFSTSGGQSIPSDGYALAGRGAVCDWLSARPASNKSRIRLRHDLIADPPLGFTPDFVLGGGPRLLRGGEPVEESSAEGFNESFSRVRHPRTAFGVRSDGRVLLVTVDGRQPQHSVGMTIKELAELLRELGAVEALNLDGGGSTTMVVGGRLVNRPSDAAGERAVSDALLVLPRLLPGR